MLHYNPVETNHIRGGDVFLLYGGVNQYARLLGLLIKLFYKNKQITEIDVRLLELLEI
jgi:hypothetical protein